MYISVIIAQTVGIFSFVLSIIMLSCKSHFKKILLNLKEDSEALFFNNITALIVSCLLLVLHNNWYDTFVSGISMIGWLLFVKSTLWLTMPQHMIEVAKYCAKTPICYVLLCILGMLFGFYFLLCGFGPVITDMAQNTMPN